MRALVRCLILFTTLALPCVAQEKLASPAEFLGYEPGDRYTLHHRVVEYFRHISSVLPNAELFTYGETYEGRPLVYLVITSQENFDQLEQIRLDNLRRAGLEKGAPSSRKTAIVWLSYNVHGNEASSTEAALVTAHALADRRNSETQEWLKNTVVIIDPCMNPDGRDRYATFYTQYGNQPPNHRYDAIEHHEPWPGGRTNHYHFDLNRDWAWCTQIESQQRIKVYNQWLPHVHVDFHEQGVNNPYFFAPAAEPLHDMISPWQRDFQLMIGKNNARHFDAKGWLYFTREIFDLYYPSYGDTYPTYNGAVGMTYEQAGGSASGLVITTETGQPLTLRERIEHHHTSGLATIEITSQNAARVNDEFQKYFSESSSNPPATYKTYVVKASNDPDKLEQLTRWFDMHAIRYGQPTSPRATRGYNYQTQSVSPVNVSPDDLIFNVYQPKSRFITTIFEPISRLSDSLTYDITAWNLMYALNLDAWALTEKIDVAKPFRIQAPPPNSVAGEAYAYIFKYQNLSDVSFLAALLANDIRVRCAERPFSVNGQAFREGTLIIPRINNEDVPDFDQTVVALANEFKRPVFTVNTGFVDEGKDLGSGELKFLRSPEVAVLTGEQVSPLSCGEIWHFFEQQIRFPVTQIATGYFTTAMLKHYNVFVIPEGSYRLFDDGTLSELASWVKSGGRLILVGSALNAFADKKSFSLKKYGSDAEKQIAEQYEKDLRSREGFPRYEEVQRKELSYNIPGAIYKLAIDNSHPLAFGMKSHYYTLKSHASRFAWLQNGWNVAYFKDSVKPVQGFAGNRANRSLRNSLLFGVEDLGQGQVIYFVDNPLFRSFWEDGKMLFANAVFVVGK